MGPDGNSEGHDDPRDSVTEAVVMNHRTPVDISQLAEHTVEVDRRHKPPAKSAEPAVMEPYSCQLAQHLEGKSNHSLVIILLVPTQLIFILLESF